MALDKETLREIKAYMDERGEVWRHEANASARESALSEVRAADARIAKRNTVFGVGVGAVLLTVAGFTYSSITGTVDNLASSAEQNAKTIAREAAEKELADLLDDGNNLIELQAKLVEGIAQSRAKVETAVQEAETASTRAASTAINVEAMQKNLTNQLSSVEAVADDARAKIDALGAQGEQLDQWRADLNLALQRAAEAQTQFTSMVKDLNDAEAQVEDVRGLVKDLLGGNDSELASAAKTIVNLALQDADVKTQIITVAEFPAGAVVPFASNRELAAICPVGWTFFTEAQNRFVLGASEKYPPGEQGGEEVVTLSVAQMPSHIHEMPVSQNDGDVWGVNAGGQGAPHRSGQPHKRVSTPTGGGQPHNNMPPYIALYYCKKD